MPCEVYLARIGVRRTACNDHVYRLRTALAIGDDRQADRWRPRSVRELRSVREAAVEERESGIVNATLDAALAWHASGKQLSPNAASVRHVDTILADRDRLQDEVEQLRAQVSTAPLVGLRLEEPPSANRWWRHVVIPKKGNRPARVTTLLSAEAREYKATIAAVVRTNPYDGNVRVSLDWYRGRRAGDLDKRIGVALDALQGSFYDNDSQIVELRARRFDDPGRPRIVVRVDPVGSVQTSLLTQP